MKQYFLHTIDNYQMVLFIENNVGKWIPSDESNSDYQDYLLWIAEGNTAEEWNPDQSAEEPVSDEPSPEQVVDDAN